MWIGIAVGWLLWANGMPVGWCVVIGIGLWWTVEDLLEEV